MLGDIDPSLVVTKDWNPVVYAGRDNVVAARFLQYSASLRKDVPLDFSAVGRMVLVLPEVNIAFDSELVNGAVVWSGGNGVVEFDLSVYAVPPGVYAAQLLAFDAQHPRGQVVISGYQSEHDFKVSFQEVWGTGNLPPPLPVDGEGVTRITGETVSALRAVYELGGAVYLLDPSSDDAPVGLFLGITTTAASAGSPVVVQRGGTLDDTGFGWAVGLVYVGPAGRLTQVPPTTGWELVVGASPSPTRINLSFDEPVLLAN